MRIHSHVCAGSRRYEDVDVDDVSDIDISITDTITVDDGPVGRSEAHHLSDEDSSQGGSTHRGGM